MSSAPYSPKPGDTIARGITDPIFEVEEIVSWKDTEGGHHYHDPSWVERIPVPPLPIIQEGWCCVSDSGFVGSSHTERSLAHGNAQLHGYPAVVHWELEATDLA